MIRIYVANKELIMYDDHLSDKPFVYDDIRSLIEDLWYVLESEVSKTNEKTENEKVKGS